jgi:uncharacterized protein YecT (DUF1311 family)
MRIPATLVILTVLAFGGGGMAANSLHARPPEAPAPPLPNEPGCEILRVQDRCTEDASTTMALNACLASSMKAAEIELQRQLEAARRSLADEPSLLAAMETTQRAWLPYLDAVCVELGLHWEGGSMRSGQFAACRAGHLLRRAQEIWAMALDGGQSGVPDECVPGI